MSETEKYINQTLPYISGNVIDIGSQGCPVSPRAIQIELPPLEFSRYTNGLKLSVSYWAGDCRDLPFRDGVVDTVYSSHLLEDFLDWKPVLREWIRVLKTGGKLIILIPEEDLWAAAVKDGQPPNDAHRHCGRVGELSDHVQAIAPFQVSEDRLTAAYPGDYSILFVATKL